MKSTLLKSLISIACCICAALTSIGQVTTSSMSGRVTDKSKQGVVGAYVVAIHIPSGTQYYSETDNSGYYRIHNMRVGAQYKVESKMVGYKTISREDITLSLGENYVLDFEMPDESLTLEEVVVTATMKDAVMNSDRTGTQTNVNSRQLSTMPTISRSITDFTRLTPQAGNSNTFGGRDTRFNAITVDGAAFNNNFGLSTTNNLPGGQAQPIALDALEEISINLAPYDVRMSQFTGASINAVTKSGDNTFKGSAYTYIRPESFTGNKVGDIDVAGANDRKSQLYGLTIGGPIIKNKLFFFVNGEFEKEISPSNAWEPSTDGKPDSEKRISRTTVADLQRVSQHLQQKYNYDPGKYQNFDNFETKNYKILARLDWNINDNNKLTLRYNEVKSTNDVLTNANSTPLSTGSRGSGRISDKSIAFQNAFYGFENTVRSFTGELNSRFSNNISNKFLVSYTHIQDKRTSDSDPFPFVDIWEGGDQYMSFGYELFSYNNTVVNNTLSFINNLTVSLGEHTITGGLSFDRLYFRNNYMRAGTSYYRYRSVDDFINDATPAAFGIVYGYNGEEAPGVDLTFGMGAMYLQDEWNITPNLKLTGGLRLELPFYFTNLDNNPNISQYTFDSWEYSDRETINHRMDVSKWPSIFPIISPRFGFNWNVTGDRKIQVRGGTGIFTGLLPFVWFTNQPTNSGMIQSPEVGLTSMPAGFKFNPDWKAQIAAYPAQFPNTPGVLPAGSGLAEVDKGFSLPQIWRSNLAFDMKLPWNTVLTVEGIYSKDINAVMQKNINLPHTTAKLSGPDNRPYWSTNRVNPTVGSAMLLTNTNKGYQYSLTAQLTKNFSRGFSGMIGYTRTVAKDISANPGSSASSAWSSNTDVSFLNDPALSYSNFAIPHRIVGSISYRIEYLKHLATTVSLYYQGSSQGRFSYTYTNDINNDGNSSDLMYIPKTKNELKFADYSRSGETITAAQQADAFWEYVEGDEYLNKHKGEYAERYAHVAPWRNRFDVKILQDIFANFGTDRRYTLQLSLDILNAGNLLNSEWGAYKRHGLASYENIRPLTMDRRENQEPIYRLNVSNASIQEFKDNAKFVNDATTSSTWGMLLGIRLLF
jgi:hypothetical protein